MINASNMISILAVGGSVRDLILGRQPNDFDFLVAKGTVADFQKAFPRAKPVGKSYEVFFQNGLEFSFPRVTGTSTEDTIDLDLAARDFTINCFGLDQDGELYVHPKGLEDYASKTLRPAFADTFKVDPLRVFRAATFLARFPDFKAHPSLIKGMREAGKQGLLENIAPDRVGVELIKAMKSAKPGNFIRILNEADCLLPWFKELANSDQIPAGPTKYHDKSILGHIAEVMDKVAGNPITSWMAMCHDLGKVLTSEKYLPSHRGHDKKGVLPAKELGSRLLLPNKYIKAGELAPELHMDGGNYTILRPGTKVDLLMKLNSQGLVENMADLCKADRGVDSMEKAHSDLEEILKVHLAEEDRNLGKKSGNKLRELRAQRLKELS